MKKKIFLSFLMSLYLSFSFAQSFCDNCDNCPEPSISSNPDLITNCGELKIALIIDETYSIFTGGGETAIREGVSAFMNSLLCTNSQMVTIEFNLEADYVEPNYRVIDDAYIADMDKYFATGQTYKDQSGSEYNYSPINATNWQAALQSVDDLAVQPDILIFFTDGSPTYNSTAWKYWGNLQCGSYTGTAQAEISNPMQLSNKLKDEGVHIFGVGVGDSSDFPTNMAKIVGSDALDLTDVNSSVATTDYILTTDFAELAANFEAAAKSICPPPTDCNILEINDSGITIALENAEILNNSNVEISFSGPISGTFITTSENSNLNQQIINITENNSVDNAWPEGEYEVSVKVLSPYSDIATSCFRELTCSEVQYIVVPVEFVSFKGNLRMNEVVLNWTTASEINNNYFEIEKSSDGKLFQRIGSIKGKGNSTVINNYEFIDSSFSNSTFYRIKQIDYDGSYSYSSVVYVENNQIQNVKIYPNPVSNYLTIEAPNNSEIILYNLLGKEVKRTKSKQLDMSDIQNGSYIIKVYSSENDIYTKRIIKK